MFSFARFATESTIVRTPTRRTRPANVAQGTPLARRAISSATRPTFAWSRSGCATATTTVETIPTRTIPPARRDLVPATVSAAPTTTAAFRPRGIVMETTIAATVLIYKKN